MTGPKWKGGCGRKQPAAQLRIIPLALHFVLLSPEGKVLRFGIGEDKEFFSYCQTLLGSEKR